MRAMDLPGVLGEKKYCPSCPPELVVGPAAERLRFAVLPVVLEPVM